MTYTGVLATPTWDRSAAAQTAPRESRRTSYSSRPVTPTTSNWFRATTKQWPRSYLSSLWLIVPKEVGKMNDVFVQAPAGLDELKKLLAEPRWRWNSHQIAAAIADLDDDATLSALPLLLYHKVPASVIQQKLDTLIQQGMRERLEACLLSLLESGLVGYYPGSLRQSDVELIVQVLAKLYPGRPVSLELAQLALQWLTSAEMVDSLAVLSHAGFTSGLVFQFWIARPDAELSADNFNLFASYRSTEDVDSPQPYTATELAALADAADFLSDCHQHPLLVPSDFADWVDELKMKDVSDQLLINLFSYDQQVALLALGFCSPAAFVGNPLDHARPYTLFWFWKPLHQEMAESATLNLDMDGLVANAFKDATPDELPQFEDKIVEDAQDLLRAGVRSELLRAFVRDPHRVARLEREIDAYFSDCSERPLREAEQRKQSA